MTNMRVARWAIWIGVTALATGACGDGDDEGSGASEDGTVAAADYAAGLCEVIDDDPLASAIDRIDLESPLGEQLEAIGAALPGLEAALATDVERVRDLGAPEVEGGGEYHAAIVAGYEDLLDEVRELSTELEGIDPATVTAEQMESVFAAVGAAYSQLFAPPSVQASASIGATMGADGEVVEDEPVHESVVDEGGIISQAPEALEAAFADVDACRSDL